MTRTITNPPALSNPTGYGYSHVVSAPGEVVFVAGQFGADASGAVVSPDFATQVRQALANLATALAGVGLGVQDVVRLGTYIVDHDEQTLSIVLQAVKDTWGDALPAQTLIGVAALALPDMRFEVDAVAVRPA